MCLVAERPSQVRHAFEQVIDQSMPRKVTASLTMDLPLFAPESMNTTAYSALP
jgi:hypothetical protein